MTPPTILSLFSLIFMTSDVFLHVAAAESCSCLSDAVAFISADALGAAFCSQYATTIWDTTTITTPLATEIITDTVAAFITITTTVVEFGSTTTTLTETIPIDYVSTKTAVVTSPTTVCYSGTTFGVQEALAIPTPARRALQQRQLAATTTPIISAPSAIQSIEASLVSAACECFLGSSATVTNTLTDFVGSGTLTATVDFTTIPTATAYYSLVTTWTEVLVTTVSTATSTVTATSTSYTPVPSNTDLGLNWYYYYNPYVGAPFPSATPNAQAFNSPDYNISGYTQKVDNFHTGLVYSTTETNYTCNVPTNEVWDCEFVAIVFQGYLWAKDGAGNYTFSSGDSDNAFVVWHGPNAYSNYQNYNYDYMGIYPGVTGSVSIPVASGELVPVTMMWLNWGGPGNALLSITNPAGTTYSDTSGFFVPANTSCTGYVDMFSP